MSDVRIIADADYIDRNGETSRDEHVCRISQLRAGKISIDIPVRAVRVVGVNLVLEFDQLELAAAIATARAKPENA